MKKDWHPTKEDFDRLLEWLDPDPEKAAQVYEQMRRNMIALFNKRGCHLSEDLADEAFNRVMRRMQNAPEGIPGSQAAYLTTVAKNLYLEYVAEYGAIAPLDPESAKLSTGKSGDPGDPDDRVFDCLEECLNHLPPDSRALILDYYCGVKRAKIEGRKMIAEKYGLSLNALRIRAHRIRDQLRQRLEDCVKKVSDQ
jgi:RNA polymerase sigma factor (sigma-70 family)